MAMYFCTGCQSFKDDDWHPMSENELCPGCEAEREERRVEVAAEFRKQHQARLESQKEGRL